MLDEPAQATRTDALEGMLGAFEGALLPLSQLQAVREQDRGPLLETHALVAYARIQMHYARAGAGDARAHEACILAARAGVYVARAASDTEEADMLDPIVGVRLRFLTPFHLSRRHPVTDFSAFVSASYSQREVDTDVPLF